MDIEPTFAKEKSLDNDDKHLSAIDDKIEK